MSVFRIIPHWNFCQRLNLPELRTSLLCIKCVNMCESVGVWLSVRFHRLLSQAGLSRWACLGHTGSVCGSWRESSRAGHCQGAQVFVTQTFPPPLLITKTRQPAGAQVVPGGVVAGCPSGSRSISVVVYLSLGTALVNELPAPVHFPLCQV